VPYTQCRIRWLRGRGLRGQDTSAQYVNIIVPYLNMGTVAIDSNACGNTSGIGSFVVANLKVLNFLRSSRYAARPWDCRRLRESGNSHPTAVSPASLRNVMYPWGRIAGDLTEPLTIFFRRGCNGVSRLRQRQPALLHRQERLFLFPRIGSLPWVDTYREEVGAAAAYKPTLTASEKSASLFYPSMVQDFSYSA